MIVLVGLSAMGVITLKEHTVSSALLNPNETPCISEFFFLLWNFVHFLQVRYILRVCVCVGTEETDNESCKNRTAVSTVWGSGQSWPAMRSFFWAFTNSFLAFFSAVPSLKWALKFVPFFKCSFEHLKRARARRKRVPYLSGSSNQVWIKVRA